LNLTEIIIIITAKYYYTVFVVLLCISIQYNKHGLYISNKHYTLLVNGAVYNVFSYTSFTPRLGMTAGLKS